MKAYTHEEIRQIYDPQAARWVVDTLQEPARFYFTSYAHALFRKGLSGERAADLGCGAG